MPKVAPNLLVSCLVLQPHGLPNHVQASAPGQASWHQASWVAAPPLRPLLVHCCLQGMSLLLTHQFWHLMLLHVSAHLRASLSAGGLSPTEGQPLTHEKGQPALLQSAFESFSRDPPLP